jgi:transposase
MAIRTKEHKRLCDWPAYEKALLERGGLVFDLIDELAPYWRAERWESRESGSGPQRIYSDQAIVLICLVAAELNCSLRKAIGFLGHVFAERKLDLPLPDHGTVVRRRQRGLKLTMPPSGPKGTPLTILVDSSGLELRGAGSWRSTKAGTQQHAFLKVHAAVDADSNESLAWVETEGCKGDSPRLPALAFAAEQRAGPLAKIIVDGAYDTRPCYELAEAIGAQLIVPPRRDARLWPSSTAAGRARNEAVLACAGPEERRAKWKHESGYHRRSLVETFFSRLKALFGQRLRGRSAAARTFELEVRIWLLNRQAQLGLLALGR